MPVSFSLPGGPDGANDGERGTGSRIQGPILVIAADYPSAAGVDTLMSELSGLPVWLKIGLELFTAEGPQLVHLMRKRLFPVFLDLKFHDIPNTVKGAVRSAVSLGVQMTTLHLSGGEAMCRAAVAGKEEALKQAADCADSGSGLMTDNTSGLSMIDDRAGSRRIGQAPLLMGITVLTSDHGDEYAIRSLVVERARLARDCGLDGVVCSGREAAAVKRACGEDFLCLCPGIRLAGSVSIDDQARVCTPGQAVDEGADFLVVGRPVTQSAEPCRVARDILREMAGHSGPA